MTRQIGRYPAQVIIQPQITAISTIVSSLSANILLPTTLVINRQDQLNQPVEVTIQEMWESNVTQASNVPTTETKVGLTATAKVMLAADKFKVFAQSFNSSITPETPQSITVACTGTTVTATTSTPHLYSTGDNVTIAGGTPSGYNGTFSITVTSATTFTYTVLSTLSAATGTLTSQSAEHGFMTLSDDAGLTYGSSALPYYTVIIRPYIGAEPTTNPELYVILPYAGIKGDADMKYSLGEQFGYSLSITGYPDPITGSNKVLRGNTALF